MRSTNEKARLLSKPGFPVISLTMTYFSCDVTCLGQVSLH